MSAFWLVILVVSYFYFGYRFGRLKSASDVKFQERINAYVERHKLDK